MRAYCKAYPLGELRKFGAWAQSATPAEGALTDEDIVYLGDDFVVLSDPIAETGELFAADSPQWREFCRAELGFAIPDDLAYAHGESDSSS
jgi:hypothetical protein